MTSGTVPTLPRAHRGIFTFPQRHKTILVRRTCEANSGGETSSFIFTVCVKSVPFYHKFLCIVLDMVAKEFLETQF